MATLLEQLKYVLSPRSIAIVGASANFSKFTGRTLKYLLKHGYTGKIYPINPAYEDIAGIQCFPAITALPESVDTAIIQIAASKVPEALMQCIENGSKSVIIHSSGMGEEGEEGQKRQRELKALAREAGVRVVGPNCAGIANITENFVLSPIVSYELDTLPKGNIALISQSGGLTGAYVTRAAARGIGFSYVISTGNEMDLEAAEYMEYLLYDNNTRVIAVFLEGLRDINQFYKVCDKAFELGKPIIVLKVGRTTIGAQAAASHTGALTGSDALYDSVFRKKGVVRVETLEDLFEVSSLFCKVRPPKGKRVGVITTTGGGATLIVEACAQAGLEFPLPSDASVQKTSAFLPSFAAKSNPLDVTMAGVGGGYQKSLQVLLEDDTFDIVVGVVGTSSQFAPELGVKPIIECHQNSTKPLVAFCNPNAEDALRLFERNQIPSFRTPEACGRALGYLVDYGRFIEKKNKASAAYHDRPIDIVPDSHVVESIKAFPNTILNEFDSKRILSAYGIHIPKEFIASDMPDAKRIAGEIGYPVVLKVLSSDIPHKTEAGVIRMGIDSEKSLEIAYREILNNARNYNATARIDGVLIQEMVDKGLEVIVGMSQDAQFGPALMFGIGGVFVEIFKDVAFRVNPVSVQDAYEMVHELKGSLLLNGYRGMQKIDIDGIVSVLLRIARLSEDCHDYIQELDINPLMVYPKTRAATAVDALIIKKQKGVS